MFVIFITLSDIMHDRIYNLYSIFYIIYSIFFILYLIFYFVYNFIYIKS